MALRSAPEPIEPQRGSLVVLRPRKADRRTEAEELRMEVRAAGLEMVAMANRITNALAAGDTHSAMHYASRLGCLGQSYLEPEPERVA